MKIYENRWMSSPSMADDASNMINSNDNTDGHGADNGMLRKHETNFLYASLRRAVSCVCVCLRWN